MSLPRKQTYTSADYWTLSEEERAELIGGQLYAMAPPNRIHQKLVFQLGKTLANYIDKHQGKCEVYHAPFAVNLDGEDEDWVEPDLSVICDKSKLTDRGCSGAPDFIIEVVSPSSRRMDYNKKIALYSEAGIREYWIVDPEKERTTVYRYEEDAAPVIFSFDQEITVGIYGDLTFSIAELVK